MGSSYRPVRSKLTTVVDSKVSNEEKTRLDAATVEKLDGGWLR